MLIQYFDKIRDDFVKLTAEERQELRDHFNNVSEGLELGESLFAEEDFDA